VTAPFRPPRKPGLRTLEPELTKIVEALAEAQARKDYAARHQPAAKENDPNGQR